MLFLVSVAAIDPYIGKMQYHYILLQDLELQEFMVQVGVIPRNLYCRFSSVCLANDIQLQALVTAYHSIICEHTYARMYTLHIRSLA